MAFWSNWPMWAKIGVPVGLGGVALFAMRDRGAGDRDGEVMEGGGDAILPLITPSTGPSFPSGAISGGGSDYAPAGGGGGSSGATGGMTDGTGSGASQGGNTGTDPVQEEIDRKRRQEEARQAEAQRLAAVAEEKQRRQGVISQLKQRINVLKARIADYSARLNRPNLKPAEKNDLKNRIKEVRAKINNILAQITGLSY